MCYYGSPWHFVSRGWRPSPLLPTDAPKRPAPPLSPAPLPSPPLATSAPRDDFRSSLDPQASPYRPTGIPPHASDSTPFTPLPPPHYRPCLEKVTARSLRAADAPPDVLLDFPPAYSRPPCQFPTPPPPPQPPLPEPPPRLDLDETFVKSLTTDVELPEHVNILFLQTVENSDLPIDAVSDLRARTPQELLERLRLVLDRLREVGLKVKPSKCAIFKKRIHFLGHVISEDGVQPQPEKIKAIREWPRPKCIRDVRAFYGLASYYRRFVRNFADIAEPLTKLTRKNTKFEWTDESQTAFDKLKRALEEATTLSFPYPNIPCIVDSDASDVAIGAVLSQVIEGVERPIAFYSLITSQTQRNNPPTRRELLAAVSAVQHFRHYLLGNKVTLRTDHHSLKWLKTFKRPEGILARWIETLAEFDYEIEHQPGRLHCNADGV